MSEINLWNDACKKSWNKARPFDALGNAYEDNIIPIVLVNLFA